MKIKPFDYFFDVPIILQKDQTKDTNGNTNNISDKAG